MKKKLQRHHIFFIDAVLLPFPKAQRETRALAQGMPGLINIFPFLLLLERKKENHMCTERGKNNGKKNRRTHLAKFNFFLGDTGIFLMETMDLCKQMQPNQILHCNQHEGFLVYGYSS
jgi:hypothetical protein